ncbi:hypothetical protein HO173_002201 [Letharia columbiana]|uniref:Kinesin-like protein n=1 Tax=Letharia columbiana TaxID=112416 RepID=A0A8H6G362_9LECA|nr:uncharacterized protein HO173_002201 [Letharia columbiana]KAF6239655.1 hypothetical protein HO173_002201 [Letharia columbiana]
MAATDQSHKPSPTSLFQVYLRLRPPPSPLVQLTQQSLYPLLAPSERYLTVEAPGKESQDGMPTHITIHPPSDSRKRAVEKFAFTKVFEEQAEQIDIFRGTGVVPLIEGVLGEGRDGLLATLGVTGSGKSHTILGSKSQRGLTQLSLDLLYRSLDTQTLHSANHPSLIASLNATDASEAQIFSASGFLDNVYGDCLQEPSRSRAPTPMMVGNPSRSSLKVPHSSLKVHHSTGPRSQWSILSLDAGTPSPEETDSSVVKEDKAASVPNAEQTPNHMSSLPSQLSVWKLPIPRMTRKQAKVRFGDNLQDPAFTPSVPKRKLPQRPSALPQFPDISDLAFSVEPNAEYAILVSMYEVYNDRIFDLLSVPSNQKDLRRRHLLFKSTEASPDRKVVAGLRKVVCGSYEEALIVLETGLMERRVAGTGSNSVSSRSHGFFCVEVKRRPRGGLSNSWTGSQLTVVDLAGSERARNAKTAGATLAEAGKINESLMYLGQCLQMQSDSNDGTKPTLVPFRQCKLTELLFSNSFPSSSHHHATHTTHHRNAQKAIMIVTADPLNEFNATSQILRYSALAREVTVPRIPSVSIVEMAFSEIARLNEEVEILNVKLTEQEERRREAEENWQKAEEKAEQIEMEVREECWGEMERRTAEERRRWMGAWGEEADRNDEHLDRKLEILTQGIQIHEDAIDQDTRTTELENENEALRRKLEALERDLQCRSPTKAPRKPQLSSPSKDYGPAALGTALSKFNGMSLIDAAAYKAQSPGKTPGKKMRKLTARKWDLMDENEMDAFENHY